MSDWLKYILSTTYKCTHVMVCVCIFFSFWISVMLPFCATWPQYVHLHHFLTEPCVTLYFLLWVAVCSDFIVRIFIIFLYIFFCVSSWLVACGHTLDEEEPNQWPGFLMSFICSVRLCDLGLQPKHVLSFACCPQIKRVFLVVSLALCSYFLPATVHLTLST